MTSNTYFRVISRQCSEAEKGYGSWLNKSVCASCRQEQRLKKYKQSLELVLHDYYSVCSAVPGPLRRLLAPHMESVLHYLQPGVSTLNWSSVNIDAYLHQVHSANARLREVVHSVKTVVHDEVQLHHSVIGPPSIYVVVFCFVSGPLVGCYRRLRRHGHRYRCCCC